MSQAAAIREMNAALTDIIKSIDEEIIKLSARLDTEGGALKSDKFNLRNVVDIRNQLKEFTTKKAPQLLGAFRDNLPSIVDDVMRQYPDLRRYAPQVIDELLFTFEGQVKDLVKTLNKEVSDELTRALRLSITGSFKVEKMQAQIAKSLGVSQLRTQALIERSVRDFGDQVVKSAGKERQEQTGEDLYYLYLGPKDSKNRPFCKVRVNKALTQKAADSMTGTQERYNCRHNLVVVTGEYVKENDIKIYRELATS